ncbi:GFA family protein [Vibrio kyushuensis]|uniref:GFA family protein n=1 Tax=Vibrio kyushuensis TaxID=2910249 RepID=UPI003D0974F4
MNKLLTGSCCCGSVEYTLEDDFKLFFFCHCQQCRKLTGSAHASNLFTSPDNITWVKGGDKTKRYEHSERSFAKVFCTECGSGLPYISKTGKFLIVPAGSLNEEPSKQLDAQIFCAEKTDWHKVGLQAVTVDGFPNPK